MMAATIVPDSECLEQALRAASTLLMPGETELPTGVQQTCRFFAERGTWFQLSRNPKVLSCRDAANRRYRLGYRGIPLADELRSYLAETVNAAGQRVFVLLHCRGTASIDFMKVSLLPELKGLHLTRAALQEFDEDTVGYGLINPFVAPEILATSGAKVLQIFDPGVFDDSIETGTMMTNAGDKSWAVEFDPRDLQPTLERDLGIVKSIIPSREHEAPRSRTIGILTGNAPESGALLWQKVNEHARRQKGKNFRGDVSYPRVVVHSIPEMGWSMELATRSNRLLPVIRNEVDKMITSGAEIISFACNTTQYYAPAIQIETERRGSYFASLPECIERWLHYHKDESIFIAGIGHVTSASSWSAFPFLRQFPNVLLPNERQSALIDSLAYEVKKNGVNPKTYQKFRTVVRTCGASSMLLLLTELSMIFDKFSRTPIASTNIFDALDIYAQFILDKSQE